MERNGFTLVEILIVVIILGILAAIVIPQFAMASDDARLSTLASDLQSVRSQLELYRCHHTGGTYPDGADSDTWTAQLTGRTDDDGSVGTIHGPYLRSFPVNLFNNSAAVAIDATGASGPGLVDADTCGWYFNGVTGHFAPNDETVAGHGAL